MRTYSVTISDTRNVREGFLVVQDWWLNLFPENWGELLSEPLVMLALIGLLILVTAILLPDDDEGPKNNV